MTVRFSCNIGVVIERTARVARVRAALKRSRIAALICHVPVEYPIQEGQGSATITITEPR